MKPLKFSRLPLADALQKSIQEEGYTSLTPIQSAAIPHLLDGRDLIGCAQTGTGKTAAFALPILDGIVRNPRPAIANRPFVLVLAPTRELSSQINESFATYGRHVRFRHTVIFGGVSQMRQVQALKRGVHIVVATPGRLLDLMQQRHLFLDKLETFVLDEADRMLDMGFLPDLKRIIAKLPHQRHSLFFTATMLPEARTLATSLLQDPIKVEVTPQSSTVDKIEQRVMFVGYGDKKRLLRLIVDDESVGQALVFTRTKRGADAVARRLRQGGVSADSIHGDKSQGARTRVINGFRDFEIQVLVATDLAARGIDIDGITHVINYDLPNEPESYVHRIGRTGRAGADGVAISFCDPVERDVLEAIEALIEKKIPVDRDHTFHTDSPGIPKSALPQRPARGKRAAKKGARGKPKGKSTGKSKGKSEARYQDEGAGGSSRAKSKFGKAKPKKAKSAKSKRSTEQGASGRSSSEGKSTWKKKTKKKKAKKQFGGERTVSKGAPKRKKKGAPKKSTKKHRRRPGS